MSQPLTVNVHTEISPLKKVITHRPDEGIGRIHPRFTEDLLFDDIVHLPQMQKEHDVFTDILKHFLGEDNVYEASQLLLEALEADEDKKALLLQKIADYEELPQRDIKILNQLSNEELMDTLVTGYCVAADAVIFQPIPNFIFTRDIAVVINDHVLITKAAKEARFRENFLSRFIFYAHPFFSKLNEEGRIINMNDIEKFPPSRLGEAVSIEGGDVMMIDKDYLLIGSSERTTPYAISLLKDILFEKNVVKNVVQINIPAARSWMHIDTIFTQINVNHVVAFKPFVVDGRGVNVEVNRIDGSSKRFLSVADFFRTELNHKMEFILSGNGISPHQEREQWTDGCNLVALRPGVALTYDRNPYTEIAFKNHGYKIVNATELLEDLNSGKVKVEDIENTIISLPSNELSRARGGSHCMTCPLLRANDFLS